MFGKKNKTKNKKSGKLGKAFTTFEYGLLPSVIADASDLFSALPLKKGGKVSSKKRKSSCGDNKLY